MEGITICGLYVKDDVEYLIGADMLAETRHEVVGLNDIYAGYENGVPLVVIVGDDLVYTYVGVLMPELHDASIYRDMISRLGCDGVAFADGNVIVYSGCNVLIRRQSDVNKEVYNHVGLFDPDWI